MRYFLSIFVLFVSFQALSDISCKDQKKLLKKTCSFKLDKIKSKNLPSLNSCKKIKDLFLDLKTKTKESYESCEKAYDKCTELCNTCNKSLVTKFKEQSEKKLLKFKKGFKKASKCFNQLSIDFEEKEKSFIDHSDHKKFLEFLKKEELRKIKEEKRRHLEYLKKEKENRIIRQKLSQTSKKVFESVSLFEWARKNKIRTYGKNNEELKQLKIDYEVKQIKKEARKERLKLEKQRREKLKKKFEAEVLKANPPQTKLDMAIEAFKETFQSYWSETKGFFGKLENAILGHFALAYQEECPVLKTGEDPSIKKLVDDFFKNEGTQCDLIKPLIADFIKEKNPLKFVLKSLNIGVMISFLGIVKRSYSVEHELCKFEDPIHELIENYDALNNNNAFFSQSLGTKNNNIYHILSYFHAFKVRSETPDFIKKIIETYDKVVEYDQTSEEKLALPVIIRHIQNYIKKNKDNLPFSDSVNSYNQSLDYKDEDHQTALALAVDQMLEASFYYKDKSNAFKERKQMSEFINDENRYMHFYERYIASLVYQLKADLNLIYTKKENKTYIFSLHNQGAVQHVYSSFRIHSLNSNGFVDKIKTVAPKKITYFLDGFLEKESHTNVLKRSLQNARACFTDDYSK